jgi:hypothetical protein
MSALTVKYVAPLFGNRLSPVDFCLLERAMASPRFAALMNVTEPPMTLAE